MKCPECVEAGEESKVFIGGSVQTLVGSTPYYDEKGKFHNHDPNTITDSYTCSRGHSWTNNRRITCPTCGEWWK